MSESTNSALTDYCRVEPPDVRSTSELTEAIIAEFPYSVRYDLRCHSDLTPEDIVRKARILFHGLPLCPRNRYDKDISGFAYPDDLVKTMRKMGFIRCGLSWAGVRIWWMYYTVCNAPREWFNQIYDTQPNPTNNFVRAVARSLHEGGNLCNLFGESLAVQNIKEIELFFGLLYDDERGTYGTTPYKSLQYRSSQFDTIARILPPYMGLGGNLSKIDGLISELQHELEQHCQPFNRNWRQKLQQISEMRFGPDFEIMQRALATPIDALMLNPDDYQLLWDVDIRTIGDVLINRDRLINELFVPEPGYGPNRVMLGRVRDALQRLGYPSFELPPSSAVQK